MRRAQVFSEEHISYVAGAQNLLWTETKALLTACLTKRAHLQLVVIGGNDYGQARSKCNFQARQLCSQSNALSRCRFFHTAMHEKTFVNARHVSSSKSLPKNVSSRIFDAQKKSANFFHASTI